MRTQGWPAESGRNPPTSHLVCQGIVCNIIANAPTPKPAPSTGLRGIVCLLGSHKSVHNITISGGWKRTEIRCRAQKAGAVWTLTTFEPLTRTSLGCRIRHRLSGGCAKDSPRQASQVDLSLPPAPPDVRKSCANPLCPAPRAIRPPSKLSCRDTTNFFPRGKSRACLWLQSSINHSLRFI